MEEGVISQAKRQVDLIEFLKVALQVEPTKKQSGYRFSSCPHCGPSEPGSMKLSVRFGAASYHCFGCMGQKDSRSVVDAASVLYGLTPIQAAKRLLMDSGNHSIVSKIHEPKPQEPSADPYIAEATLKIYAALQGRKNDDVVKYLSATRCISPWVIQEMVSRGMLRFMPQVPMHAKGMLEKHVGKDLMISAKMWNPEKKAPVIAFRPMVTFFPGNDRAEYRLIKPPRSSEPKSLRYGSDLYPWYFEQDSTETAIVEGIIDLMSLLSLGWTGSVIGLPGVNSWRAQWFVANAKKKGVRRFVSFFDNDNDIERKGLIKNPGQYWTNELDKALKSEGLHHEACQPQSGDLNNHLSSGSSLGALLSRRAPLLKAA